MWIWDTTTLKGERFQLSEIWFLVSQFESSTTDSCTFLSHPVVECLRVISYNGFSLLWDPSAVHLTGLWPPSLQQAKEMPGAFSAFLERNGYEAISLILTFTAFLLGTTPQQEQPSLPQKIEHFLPRARALKAFFTWWLVYRGQGRGTGKSGCFCEAFGLKMYLCITPTVLKCTSLGLTINLLDQNFWSWA